MRRIEEAVRRLPGNNYEFTQPIQMRFNELLAGMRGDLAVKVFGDEFEPMLAAANRIAGVLRGVAGRRGRAGGAGDRPALPGDHGGQGGDRPARAQPQRRAGGDRHRHRRPRGRLASSRATAASPSWCGCRRRCAPTSRRCATCPWPCPGRAGRAARRPCRCASLACFRLTEGPNQVSRENGKRRVVVHGQRPRPRHRLRGGGGAGGGGAGGAAAVRLLHHLGRAVREPGRGRASA